MKTKREDFRKKIARHDGGFTFQAEWLNMLRGKDDNYRDWFLDVVMAYGIFGYILCDMPDKLKVAMASVIDTLYYEITFGDNPLRYRLESSEQERFESEYRDYCYEVEELKEEGGQQ